MKFKIKAAPNYRDNLSTKGIMRDLTIGLLVVFIVRVIYYFTSISSEYGIRSILLLLTSLVSAFVTEAIFALVIKKDVKTYIANSFGWVTAIILTLMVQVNLSYYALAISTSLALLFAKLVFGGFGQNIFNPAAVGRAIIASSFGGSVVADIVSSATPTQAFANLGWFVNNATFTDFANSYGGLTNLFMGFYPGSIGETSVLVILIVGIFLAYRKVIDYRVPITYILTMFITTLLIGLLHNQGLWYPLFHIFTGGAVFGAVFMLTDPVTNPTVIPGRIMFAMGAAFITVLIRINAYLPEGVLYSILLMNMMTPAIERLFDSNQIFAEKKNLNKLIIFFVIGLLICVGMSMLKAGPSEDVARVLSHMVRG